jgi:hypothetical protein
MPEKEVKRIAGKDLEPHQLYGVLEHLRGSDQIFVLDVRDANGTTRKMMVTKRKFDELGDRNK